MVCKTEMQITIHAKFSRFLKHLDGGFWPPGSNVPGARARSLRTLDNCSKDKRQIPASTLGLAQTHVLRIGSPSLLLLSQI